MELTYASFPKIISNFKFRIYFRKKMWLKSGDIFDKFKENVGIYLEGNFENHKILEQFW